LRLRFQFGGEIGRDGRQFQARDKKARGQPRWGVAKR
jgi:hypothetical protein